MKNSSMSEQLKLQEQEFNPMKEKQKIVKTTVKKHAIFQSCKQRNK